MKKLAVAILFSLCALGLFPQENGLTGDEIQGLLLMREEEKLARDVYNALYGYWNQNIFKNIAKSEETHMERVKTLLDRYGLADPVQSDRPGVFRNGELQDVYDSFTSEGKKSLYDALYMGAAIEDLDIYDLENLMEKTDKEEILSVYTSLRDGSVNHINAFNRKLAEMGEGYKARYISESYLSEILRL